MLHEILVKLPGKIRYLLFAPVLAGIPEAQSESDAHRV